MNAYDGCFLEFNDWIFCFTFASVFLSDLKLSFTEAVKDKYVMLSTSLNEPDTS